MKTVMKNSNIAFLYAFLTTVALVGYFLLMRVLGLAEHTTLRLFNFVILFVGVYKSITTFKEMIGDDFSYFRGLAMGMKMVLLTAVFFVASILLYYLFDASFVNNILLQGRVSGTASLAGMIGIIMIEAIGSGVMCTFMCMQYLKNPEHVVPHHSRQTEEETL